MSSDEELRQYFLYIKNVKKYSRTSSTIAICAIKFFFEKTLNRDFTAFKLVRAPRKKKLPVILSVDEVPGCAAKREPRSMIEGEGANQVGERRDRQTSTRRPRYARALGCRHAARDTVANGFV